MIASLTFRKYLISSNENIMTVKWNMSVITGQFLQAKLPRWTWVIFSSPHIGIQLMVDEVEENIEGDENKSFLSYSRRHAASSSITRTLLLVRSVHHGPSYGQLSGVRSLCRDAVNIYLQCHFVRLIHGTLYMFHRTRAFNQCCAAVKRWECPTLRETMDLVH